jgi:hypothetical protein
MTRSYLYYLQESGGLPRDIVFKAYCSAPPKPGNLFYAYDFDFITRGGWGLTVVNAADWVPEGPFTVQTLRDFNPDFPFRNIDKALKKQPRLVRLVIRGKYNKLRRRTRKAAKAFRSILGEMAYRQVRKALPGFRPPNYADGSNYQRAGLPIVLEPDSAYYRLFPNATENLFQHHVLEAYDWLV